MRRRHFADAALFKHRFAAATLAAGQPVTRPAVSDIPDGRPPPARRRPPWPTPPTLGGSADRERFWKHLPCLPDVSGQGITWEPG